MIDTYNKSAERASKVVTETFSTSFSSAITLLAPSIRQDVYNIYGLVRVADEIADSYQGVEAEPLLRGLEDEVYRALETGFSANIIVHSFCRTASKYDIKADLIAPFFASMRTDGERTSFTKVQYEEYIYGSAEVIGLMCLKVFTGGDIQLYEKLEAGARALGAAYQKVNFLRDIRDDYYSRGRFYFPDTTYETFSEQAKAAIVADAKKDFSLAADAAKNLPENARFATKLSYDYYSDLLNILDRMPVEQLKDMRASVSKWVKLRYFLKARIRQYAS